MRTSIRLVALACASLVALAFVGAALATPRLVIANPDNKLQGSSPTTVRLSQTQSDSPTAKITIYVPLGYDADLAKTAGATIGSLTGHVKLNQLAGAIVPVQGDITSDDPAKYPTPPCDPTKPQHDAVWVFNLTASGQTIRVPVYVDRVTAGPETQFAGYKIQACFGAPTDPATPLGAQLIDVTFTVDQTFVNPTTKGNYPWRALFTPYNGTTPNPLGTVETQSIVPLPVQLSINGKFNKKRHTVGITGRLTQAGAGVGGVKVKVYAGLTRAAAKLLGTATTNAAGVYGGVLTKVTRTVFFRTTASVATKTTTCVSPLPATSVPGGCVSATVSPYLVNSNQILKVVVKR